MGFREIFSKLGKVEDHPEILKIYCYDFSFIPKLFSSFIKKPVIVVQPSSVEDLLQILKLCERYEIPLVPRGSATSAYGGSVPLKSCVIVDFKKMSRFEFQDGKVIAESGAIWIDIEREARKRGEALRIYPTSALVSTVGGWIAQGGFGIGSLRYGGIKDNVEWLEVVDFEGVKIVKGDELKYYVGASGATGLITKACIKLRKNSEISSLAIESSFKEAISKIKNAYHASFKDSKYLRLEGYKLGDTLLICSENGENNEMGEELWRKRLTPLKIVERKKKIFSETCVPYEKAEEFFNYARNISEGVEAVFTRDCVVFISTFSASYGNMLKALKLVKIAEKLGGEVYAKGMFFSHKCDEELRRYKRRVDPKNLLNPGKIGWNAFSITISILERFLWLNA
ncbi:MAG: FAD-binding oxidoreductase [Archaeoglobaceae archaeon]